MKRNSQVIRVRTACITMTMLLASGCGGYEPGKVEQESIVEVENSTNDAIEYNGTSLPEQTGDLDDEHIQKAKILLKNFDYTTQEYPINTDIYDMEMDQKYKEAFLELIFHKEPMTYNVYRDGEEIIYNTYYYTFTENIGANWYLVKNDFVRDMVYTTEYWYLDFDGDGMPELVFDLPGGKEHPYILKYDFKKENAYVYLTGESSCWHFLSPRKLCYYNSARKGVIRYGLRKYDASGDEIINISFGIKEDCEPWEYWVWYRSEENPDNIVDDSIKVNMDVWDELTKNFFDIIDKIPASMTFDEVFGDMALPYID